MGNFAKKPYLLFGMGRSGTTPVYIAVGSYLNQTEGIQSAGEIFNPRLSFERFGTEIRFVPGPISRILPTDNVRNILEQDRLQWIRGSEDKYFFKVLCDHLSPGNLEWLCKNYEWIFIERRNVFDHLLSCMISASANKWYEDEGLRIQENSLIADLNYVRWYEDRRFLFNVLKVRLAPQKIIQYDDLEKDAGPANILKILGFEKKIDFSQIKIPVKQNPYDKLSRFKNADEIVAAYRKSELQPVYPI